MSLMEKLKSMLSGGSSDTADAHADHDHSDHDHDGHDHAGHDHSHEPAAETAPVEEGENQVD
jgi:hypothetical protein